MTLICLIRYQIDPFQREAFADTRGTGDASSPLRRTSRRLLPAPRGHERHRVGLIAFDSLAAYEAYRARLKVHPKGVKISRWPRTKRLILREERTFVEVVDGTFGTCRHDPPRLDTMSGERAGTAT